MLYLLHIYGLANIVKIDMHSILCFGNIAAFHVAHVKFPSTNTKRAYDWLSHFKNFFRCMHEKVNYNILSVR